LFHVANAFLLSVDWPILSKPFNTSAETESLMLLKMEGVDHIQDMTIVNFWYIIHMVYL